MCHPTWKLEGVSLSSPIHCLWTCLLHPKFEICFPSRKLAKHCPFLIEDIARFLACMSTVYIAVSLHKLDLLGLPVRVDSLTQDLNSDSKIFPLFKIL
jgi:hypothetical protein